MSLFHYTMQGTGHNNKYVCMVQGLLLVTEYCFQYWKKNKKKQMIIKMTSRSPSTFLLCYSFWWANWTAEPLALHNLILFTYMLIFLQSNHLHSTYICYSRGSSSKHTAELNTLLAKDSQYCSNGVAPTLICKETIELKIKFRRITNFWKLNAAHSFYRLSKSNSVQLGTKQ